MNSFEMGPAMAPAAIICSTSCDSLQRQLANHAPFEAASAARLKGAAMANQDFLKKNINLY
jgi:hypothetical protein